MLKLKRQSEHVQARRRKRVRTLPANLVSSYSWWNWSDWVPCEGLGIKPQHFSRNHLKTWTSCQDF